MNDIKGSSIPSDLGCLLEQEYCNCFCRTETAAVVTNKTDKCNSRLLADIHMASYKLSLKVYMILHYVNNRKPRMSHSRRILSSGRSVKCA
jgi:hypothetical protein